MLQDREVPIDKFINITAGGIKIADYDQVQSAIVKRYKEVYGSDIDLSNTTADGVFINDISLIINNILQSFKVLYSNLDVNTASGVYLDSLCRLSNVTRKSATQSTAYLRITATSTTTLNSGTKFVDYTGNEWTYNGQSLIIREDAADSTQILVTCDTYGAVEAPAGSIYQTLEASYLVVEQESPASVGLEDESDAELRARRAQSTGAQGVTVLESLVGELFDIDGVKDVQVINNNTDSDITASDTTVVKKHSVYVIIREIENLNISEETIGQIIYNKLTPGINTNEFTGNSSNGINQRYVAVLDENITWLNQTLNWKKAVPIKPTCSVTITPLTFFANSTTAEIVKQVMSYLNNVRLSQLPTKNDMIVTAMYADPTFKGAATYIVKDITLPAGTNPNTYYNYTSFNYPQDSEGNYQVDSNGDLTIIFN